jgi:hypothetical protein
MVLAETVPPAVVGVLFLGDTTRHGLTGIAALGFVLAVVSALALARFGEAGHGDEGHEQPKPDGLRPSVRHRAALNRRELP